jgi:hypothetical protein
LADATRGIGAVRARSTRAAIRLAAGRTTVRMGSVASCHTVVAAAFSSSLEGPTTTSAGGYQQRGAARVGDRRGASSSPSEPACAGAAGAAASDAALPASRGGSFTARSADHY